MFSETPDADAVLDRLVYEEETRPCRVDLYGNWRVTFDRIVTPRFTKSIPCMFMDIRAVLAGTAPGSPSPEGS